VAEAGGGEAKVSSEMGEGLAADVAQLDMLEIGPDPLIGIEVWGVAGELLQADALGTALSQEVLDRLATVDRCAVPDDQEFARDVVEQVLEEADDVRALIRLLLHEHQQPTGWGDATDDRQVISTQGQSEDGCLATWGVGPDGTGEQIEARLVDPDDGSPLLVSPLFRAGQRSVRQVSIATSLRWLARVMGFCTLQPAARRSLPT
jgi:hypothetical protein